MPVGQGVGERYGVEDGAEVGILVGIINWVGVGDVGGISGVSRSYE